MTTDCDILIVGGGLNGPPLALALAAAGLSVTVVDALPRAARAAADFDGRAYALALASKRLLDAVGIWPAVATHAETIRGVRAADGRVGARPSRFVLSFDDGELEEGPMGYMLEDRFLRGAALDAMAAAPGIRQISGARVTAQWTGRQQADGQQASGPQGKGQQAEAPDVTVETDAGETITARLLVGCDGRRSGVAERAGIRRRGHDYGQIALVCAIEHERPHDGIAQQLFSPGGPLAVLPLPGNRSAIVWSEPERSAAALAQADDAVFLAALAQRLGDYLGAIRLAGGRYSYPLSLSLAESFTDARLALVGDAAHGVHPIAGQGLNLGLRDVGALAQVVIEAARRGEDIGTAAVLARYQRWRRFDTTALAYGMDAVNLLFSNDLPGLRALRDLGLGAVGRIGPLRRRFIREAAGLTGDLPRLLQGRPV